MVFEGPSPVSTSHSLPDRPVHVYAPTLNVNMLRKYRPVMFAPQPILQSPTVNPANPPVQWSLLYYKHRYGTGKNCSFGTKQPNKRKTSGAGLTVLIPWMIVLRILTWSQAQNGISTMKACHLLNPVQYYITLSYQNLLKGPGARAGHFWNSIITCFWLTAFVCNDICVPFFNIIQA